MGPDIQRYWKSRAGEARSLNTQELNEYSLTLRATSLSMAMQADIMDALSTTPGVQGQSFVSQSGKEMRFLVKYAGGLPLQLALYQKLRSKPGFGAMVSTAQGRSVLLCLSGCGTGK